MIQAGKGERKVNGSKPFVYLVITFADLTFQREKHNINNDRVAMPSQN